MIYEKFGRFYDAVMGDRAESAACSKIEDRDPFRFRHFVI
jgi:hypothetical protein